MAVITSIQKAISGNRFKIFFSIVIASAIATAVTVDQQSKNLIKLLIVTGIFVSIFNWQELKRNSREFDKNIALILVLYYLSILLSIAVNPINKNTLHDAQIMSIGFTSIFIWALMISIQFRADYFWWGIVLCAISSGVYAFYEVGIYGISHRAVGSVGKPIMFGDVAMISGVLSFTAINHFKKHKLPVNLLPHFAIIMGISASFLSGSRGGWIFLPFAALIILFLRYKTGGNPITWKRVIISLIIF